MAGDTFGLAPKAKLWLFTAAVKLTKVWVLLALEMLARADFTREQIKAGTGILCLPFGFANTPASKHPLATALSYLVIKGFKVVTTAPNNKVGKAHP